MQGRMPRGSFLSSPPAVAVASGPEALALLASLPMRCGGCGSKVGSTVLSRTLARIREHQRSSLEGSTHATVSSATVDGTVPGQHAAGGKPLQAESGLDAPDDAAILSLKGLPQDTVLVQTVDFFKSFVSDPFVFGQVAANHALGDCYAMGALPGSALAIATVPVSMEDKMEEDLFQMLAGAVRALNSAGCQLAGGHTAEGEQLSMGFSITGYCSSGDLLHKGGMRPGDVIILTKPIGTGVLFAANMRHRAKGRWIDGALQSMLQSNSDAVPILRVHGATSATDVTGFGLVGHLVEMVKATNSQHSTPSEAAIGKTAFGVSVQLDPEAVPVLAGAEECMKLGIMSSLYPSNLRLRREIASWSSCEGDARAKVLFDPQTAGGLLASVPALEAHSCRDALVRAGYASATIVGKVVQAEAGFPSLSIVNLGDGIASEDVREPLDSTLRFRR